MFLANWMQKRRLQRNRTSRTPPTFRPCLQLLEDRTVLSRASGPATHLQVIVPPNVLSGTAFSVAVVAENASNRIATSYTGTVALSLETADADATLPAAYTFTAKDHGVHRFQVTLSATGIQTIDAADTADGSTITGKASTTVNPAPVATTLKVVTTEKAVTGVATRVTVQVLDASGHILPTYTGTVTVSSSDTTATGASDKKTTPASLPISYTFTAKDHGVHTFSIIFNTGDAAGTATTVSASGTIGDVGAITGKASTTVYLATTVTSFALVPVLPIPIRLPPIVSQLLSASTFLPFPHGGFALTGTPMAFRVVALNAIGQVVKGYTGTVSFTSTDKDAVLADSKDGDTSPPDSFSYTFTAADKGAHVFYATFNTTGAQTLTVADSTNTAVTGTGNVMVINNFLMNFGGGGSTGGGKGGPGLLGGLGGLIRGFLGL